MAMTKTKSPDEGASCFYHQIIITSFFYLFDPALIIAHRKPTVEDEES
jgi:hypothetical protein